MRNSRLPREMDVEPPELVIAFDAMANQGAPAFDQVHSVRWR
jgi:hypothetical protein